jgi:hypothetical protein
LGLGDERRFRAFRERRFSCPLIRKEVRLLTRKHLLKEHMVTAYWSVISMLSAGLITMQPVMADSIFDRIRSIVTDIYGQIVAISTIVAVTVASIALIVRMISRNQRAVDEATSWLKRIVVAWIILNSLGFVVAYLQPLVAGGQYTG